MPTVSIQISEKVSPEIKKEILITLSKEVAKILSKPEQWIMIDFVENVTTIFAGTFDPSAKVKKRIYSDL